MIHPRVIAHDDVFPQDTDDEMWLAEAAKHDWVVLMKDDRLRYRPGAQRAILEHQLRCFCLHPSKDLTGDQMADALESALRRILSTTAAPRFGGYIKG